MKGRARCAHDERHEQRGEKTGCHAGRERVGQRLGAAGALDDGQAYVHRARSGQRDGLDAADLRGGEREENDAERFAQHVVQERHRARDRVARAGNDARRERVPAEARADGEPLPQRHGGEERVDHAREQRAGDHRQRHENDAESRAAQHGFELALQPHAEADEGEQQAQSDDEPAAGHGLKGVRVGDARNDKIAEQHPRRDHREDDERGFGAGGVRVCGSGWHRRRFLRAAGQGIAVDVQRTAHGERAEHTERHRQRGDEQRLHADDAEVVRHLAVRAHAQTHHENERVDADAQQRIDKAEAVGVAAQARGEQVAGDHDRPVEGERGHREYLPFKKEGGVLRRPPFAL